MRKYNILTIFWLKTLKSSKYQCAFLDKHCEDGSWICDDLEEKRLCLFW